MPPLNQTLSRHPDDDTTSFSPSLPPSMNWLSLLLPSPSSWFSVAGSREFCESSVLTARKKKKKKNNLILILFSHLSMVVGLHCHWLRSVFNSTQSSIQGEKSLICQQLCDLHVRVGKDTQLVLNHTHTRQKRWKD